MPATALGHVKYCKLWKALTNEVAYDCVRPANTPCRTFTSLACSANRCHGFSRSTCWLTISRRLGYWYHGPLGETDRRSSTMLFFGGRFGTVHVQRHLQRYLLMWDEQHNMENWIRRTFQGPCLVQLRINLAWVLSLSYLAKYLVVSSYRYCIFFSAANLNHQLFVWLSLLGLFFFAAFPSEATPNAATQGAHAFAYADC